MRKFSGWPRSRTEVPAEGPIPYIGNVLSIHSSAGAANAQCLAQDLVPLQFDRSDRDAVDICSALVLARTLKKPDQFLLGLTYEIAHDAGVLLDAYVAESGEIIEAANRITPKLGETIKAGFRRYVKLSVEDRERLFARLARAPKYPLVGVEVGEDVAIEYGRGPRVLVAAITAGCSLPVLFLWHHLWLALIIVAVSLFLAAKPFRRWTFELVDPHDVMAKIRRRAEIKHETLQRARSLLATLERDECWSQSWMSPPRLKIDNYDLHWVHVTGMVEARFGSKSERYEFTLAFDTAYPASIDEQLKNLRSDLDDNMLAADKELTRRLRAYGQRARIKHQNSQTPERGANEHRGFIRLPAAARYLGLTDDALRREVQLGRIHYKMRGDRPSFTKEWLDEYRQTPDGGPSL
jgi:hypothetical protein